MTITLTKINLNLEVNIFIYVAYIYFDNIWFLKETTHSVQKDAGRLIYSMI